MMGSRVRFGSGLRRVAAGAVVLSLLASCGMFGGAGTGSDSGSGSRSSVGSNSNSAGDRAGRPMSGASAQMPVAAPLPVVKAAGETVTIDDARSGSPVELRLGQQLVVRLHYEISTAAQWELTDFVAGALAVPPPPRFDTHNGDAASVLGGDQIWRFKPVAPGHATLNFAYRTPRSREEASRTATFEITVR